MTTKKTNMLSTMEPWDAVAGGYAETTMKWFAPVADRALSLVDIRGDCNILDLACGPGTLALKVAGKASSVRAIDFSREMVDIFRKKAGECGIANVEVECGDGQALPYGDEEFDAVFSIFGLMFFPDRGKGYAEVYRTLKPGGKFVMTSWAPVARSPAMQAMFGAVRTIKPEIPEPQTDVESLENPEFFRAELEGAGFREVEVSPFTIQFTVSSIGEFWRDMVRGSAPLVMLKKGFSEKEWAEKEALALEYLRKTITEVPTSLGSDGWIGYGEK